MHTLDYRICFCSCEDAKHPARDLCFPSKASTGWLSHPNAAYPIEIGVQFDGLVEIRELQITTHETCVPTKIDISLGKPPDGLPAYVYGYESCVFSPLGFLRYSSPESRSNAAREMKRVSLNTPKIATFMTLLLGKHHPDLERNPNKQVGLHSVKVVGRPLRYEALSTVTVSRLGEYYPSVATFSAHDIPIELELLKLGMTLPPLQPKKPERYRELFIEEVAELESDKARAILREDYEAAKRCTQSLRSLAEIGAQISAIEAKKEEAVENEEFAVASALKEQIEKHKEKGRFVFLQTHQQTQQRPCFPAIIGVSGAPDSVTAVPAPAGMHVLSTGNSARANVSGRSGSESEIGARAPSFEAQDRRQWAENAKDESPVVVDAEIHGSGLTAAMIPGMKLGIAVARAAERARKNVSLSARENSQEGTG
eukprot:Rmarinus@m.18207